MIRRSEVVVTVTILLFRDKECLLFGLRLNVRGNASIGAFRDSLVNVLQARGHWQECERSRQQDERLRGFVIEEEVVDRVQPPSVFRAGAVK